jgi:hypothetical protein
VIRLDEEKLTMNDLCISKIHINPLEIEKYNNEDDFMNLAVELFKEIGMITSILSHAYRMDKNIQPRNWTRNEAILGGLMIRIVKLQIGMLQQTCENRLELCFILMRCLIESIINLRYLIKKSKEESYQEYIEYSLRVEKKLFDEIEENVLIRGHELPIETRMKNSINESFKKSGIDLTNLKNTRSWGGNLYQRADYIGMGRAYLNLYSLPSHTIHGNWEDLLRFHIEEVNDKFKPSSSWKLPRPQIILFVSVFSAYACLDYLFEALPESADRDFLEDYILDCIEKIKTVDNLHEKFLQRELP